MTEAKRGEGVTRSSRDLCWNCQSEVGGEYFCPQCVKVQPASVWSDYFGVFGLLFTFALSFELNLGPLHDQARRILNALQATAANSPASSQGFLANELSKLVHVHRGTLVVLAITSLVYMVLELVEAIGLWHERRWAEYLTAVATAGIP